MPFADAVTWIDAGGEAHDLTDLGPPTLHVLVGRSGFFMPPVRTVDELIPLQPGALLRDVQHDVRELDLPLFLRESGTTALRDKLRAVLRWFDPARGDGVLRVRAADGKERELTARQVGEGLAGEEDFGTSGLDWQQVVITLRAWDPYWYDRDELVLDASLVPAVGFFPFFPLRLSAADITAGANVPNVGDVPLWPVWRIHGPGAQMTLRNTTTGLFIAMPTLTLGAGDDLVIDTRPGYKSVTLVPDQNMFAHLTADSALWPLPVGENVIQLEISGATETSTIRMHYRPRYLSA